MAYDFIDSIGNDVDVVSDSEVSIFYRGKLEDIIHNLLKTLIVER